MKKRIIIISSIVLLLFSFSVHTIANTAIDDSLKSANDNYTLGKYEEALNTYKNILKSGYDSEILYYNLGNAHYKLGHIPEAIWCYEKTLLHNPQNQDAQFNLKMANLQIVDKIEPLPEMFTRKIINYVLNLFSPTIWTYISLSLFWLMVITFAMYLWLSRIKVRRTSLVFSLIFLFLGIITTYTSFHANKRIEDPNTAIVYPPNVYVKSAPEDAGTDIFIIHQGLKVKILDQVGNWYKIKLADGKIGWTPLESVLPL